LSDTFLVDFDSSSLETARDLSLEALALSSFFCTGFGLATSLAASLVATFFFSSGLEVAARLRGDFDFFTCLFDSFGA